MAKYINPDTDGQFYSGNSMVKANCHDCMGCSDCCEGMGDSILLDPYDFYQFEIHAGESFENLLETGKIALTLADGLIIPHLAMTKEETCAFLDSQKRCSIHDYRPGLCRLFPLGRDYQENELTYILLKDACLQKNRSKVKVDKWIGVAPFKQYEAFIKDWHDFRKEMSAYLADANEKDAQVMNSYILKQFYMLPYSEGEFYQTFQERMGKIRNLFA